MSSYLHEFIFVQIHAVNGQSLDTHPLRTFSRVPIYWNSSLKLNPEVEQFGHSARSVTMRLDTDECVKLTASTSIEKLERQVKLDWVSLLIVGSDCLSRHCADGCRSRMYIRANMTVMNEAVCVDYWHFFDSAAMQLLCMCQIFRLR